MTPMSPSPKPRPPAKAPAPSESDALWAWMRQEGEALVETEPLLKGFGRRLLLDRESLADALCVLLAGKLEDRDCPAVVLRSVFESLVDGRDSFICATEADLRAVYDRDPAATSLARAFLFFKGFQGLQAHRLSHALWNGGRRELALWLQSRVSEVFAMDIHPAAPVGRGIMVDHATGLVVGETAVIEDDVSILQEVTLGGTGKDSGDRHPKVRRGVLIGAGAKILGNIEIGACAKVGAGSVVLTPVPPCTTVAGVPARIVAQQLQPAPASAMDHSLPCE